MKPGVMLIRIARHVGRAYVVFCALAAAASIPGTATAQVKRGPFTEPPRSVRTRPYDVKHTRLELKFDWERERFEGRVAHRLTPFRRTRSLALDAAKMTVKKVELRPADGDSTEPAREVKFTTKGERLTVELDTEYGPDDELVVVVDYVVQQPERGVHFVVPDKNEPQQERIVWTQSEPEQARYWFPCFDAPNERMTSETLVTVPGDYFVLSNGTLKSSKLNADGTRTWHWLQAQTHVAYLVSVVAGRFEAYEQQWQGIPIVSYVPPGRMSDAERSFGKTPEMMDLFSRQIGYRYPWPKYAQICCDEYGGGMEHTSATTLTLNTLHDERAHLDVSSDNLVAHELAHQWWGDLLTCKDWAELWLNESFATYFATLWTEHDKGWDEAAWQRYNEGQSYMREDSGRYRRPIVSYRYEHPRNMFDRHSYPKGGRVLHMLRWVLGDEAFWNAIRRYAHQHEFGIVETADLRAAIEDATGEGINWFFDEWIYHGGHPEFDVDYTWDADEKLVRLTVKQTQEVDSLTPLFRMPVEIELTTADETVTRKITVSKAEETFHLSLPQRPTRVCFDPRDWVLKTLKFEKSKQELLDQLRHSPHVICRLRAVEGLAELRPDEDAQAALAAAAKEDAFWGVRQEAVKHLAKFAGGEVRAVLLAAAANDPKSDVRREAIRALGGFPHAQTRKALRETIQNDPSYFAVADALRALVKVDRKNAAADMLAALGRTSHREVILQAAADGLATLNAPGGREKLEALLEPPVSADRRSAVLRGLARLGKGDPEITKLLAQQLSDARRQIRSQAISALENTGDPGAIDVLLSHRAKVQRTSTLAAIDAAVEKLRKETNLDKIQNRVNALEKQNRALIQRLDSLEKGK